MSAASTRTADTRMERLLIIDDDLSLLESLKLYFEDEGEGGRPAFAVITASSGAEGLSQARASPPSLVILDMMLPDRSGLELTSELKSVCGEAPILLVTAYHDMATTIRAMKAGAFDYLHKPFSELGELDRAVSRALEVRKLASRATVAPAPRPVRLGDIVGQSPVMQRLVKEVGKIAASHASVLITGESGTGKELIAQVIHHYSSDEPRPFIGINCSAIVDTLLESELFGHEKGAFTGATAVKPGKFELAEAGTVFLDEIGDMSLMLQAKLLRVLQEREFERVGGVKRLRLRARVIAATHRNLREEVEKRRFREDLFQRLEVITLHLPPLRERREDIPQLIEHLLEKINDKVHKHVTRVPEEVLDHLCRLPWRGNVRELENVLTRCVVRSPGEVLLADGLPPLPPEPGAEPPVATFLSGVSGESVDSIPTLAEAERVLILRAMKASGGHKGRACQVLGISRPTLERKLQKYGVRQNEPAALKDEH